jgi:hypothetical protein
MKRWKCFGHDDTKPLGYVEATDGHAAWQLAEAVIPGVVRIAE